MSTNRKLHKKPQKWGHLHYNRYKKEKEKVGGGIMPCPHKGDKTLATHSQHLEIPCQDFPADFKQKVLLGRWYSCFGEVRCPTTQLEESELNIYRMINSLKHTKHENS